MKLPDGTILVHKSPYDPVKAHEYYIRTRQLTGRKKGQDKFTVKYNGKTSILTQQQLTEQRAYAAKRVGEITQKLVELSSKLRKAMADAKEKKAKAKREAAKPDTASEKAKAARESKQYREKHKTSLATKRKHADTKKTERADPVAELETKVTQIKDNLKAALEKQRALATATKN